MHPGLHSQAVFYMYIYAVNTGTVPRQHIKPPDVDRWCPPSSPNVIGLTSRPFVRDFPSIFPRIEKSSWINDDKMCPVIRTRAFVLNTCRVCYEYALGFDFTLFLSSVYLFKWCIYRNISTQLWLHILNNQDLAQRDRFSTRTSCRYNTTYI